MATRTGRARDGLAGRIAALARVAGFQIDFDRKTVMLSPEFHAWFPPDTPLTQPLDEVLSRIAPESRTWVAAAFARARAGEAWDGEFLFLAPDGRSVWFRTTGAPDPPDAPGHAALGTVQEVTDLVNARLALVRMNVELQRNADRRFADLFQHAPDALLLVDHAGVIVQANRRADVLFGDDRMPVAGRPLEDLLPAGTRERHRQLTETYFANPVVRPMGSGRGPLLARRLDGGTFPAEVSIGPVNDVRGTLVLAAVRDVSAQVGIEERLRESLREKDALLQELHHRVKNNLQVVCSLLDLQAESVGDRSVRALMEESRDRVRAMALIHEHLFQSEQFDRVDFAEYAANLAGRMVSTYSLAPGQVTVAYRLRAVFTGLSTAVPLGLILNELVSNALKHGFADGRKGTLTIDVRPDPEAGFTLAVSDDGAGFEEPEGEATGGSLGLLLVRTLGQQLGAALEIRSTPGTGTRISIRVPAPPGGNG